MKRQPSVSLQRAMVSPGMSRGTKTRRALQHTDGRIGVGIHHEQAGVVVMFEMNCLRPLITHSPFFFTARVCMAASGTL
jgi:hypothetical protein